MVSKKWIVKTYASKKNYAIILFNSNFIYFFSTFLFVGLDAYLKEQLPNHDDYAK